MSLSIAVREDASPVRMAVVRVTPTRSDAAVVAVRRGLRTALPVASRRTGPAPGRPPTRRISRGTSTGPRSSTPTKEAMPPASIAGTEPATTARTSSAAPAETPSAASARRQRPAAERTSTAGVGTERGQRRDPGRRARRQPGGGERDQRADGERRAGPHGVERGRPHVGEPAPDERDEPCSGEGADGDAEGGGHQPEGEGLEADRAAQLAAGHADAAQQREVAHPLREEDGERVGDDQHAHEEGDDDEEQRHDRDDVHAAGDLRLARGHPVVGRLDGRAAGGLRRPAPRCRPTPRRRPTGCPRSAAGRPTARRARRPWPPGCPTSPTTSTSVAAGPLPMRTTSPRATSLLFARLTSARASPAAEGKRPLLEGLPLQARVEGGLRDVHRLRELHAVAADRLHGVAQGQGGEAALGGRVDEALGVAGGVRADDQVDAADGRPGVGGQSRRGWPR